MKAPARAARKSVKIHTLRSHEDEQFVADQVIAGYIVLVDFKYIDEAIKQRVKAFLDGTMCGLDGKMIALRDDLLLLLPNGVLEEENMGEYKLA
ncbi:MAG: cell division protein SepF [Candidatus Margulisbacteria bacterium]|jgi:FtsZ-interacting cell division protein YlmF|nr:cell division protein SepF [Candidatus Margulisiibacteriota bacterium]MDR1323851.1 cell division protein SepF [Candidatus Margulisiibacteriota bacterium]